jgi:hypothetical protein
VVGVSVNVGVKVGVRVRLGVGVNVYVGVIKTVRLGVQVTMAMQGSIPEAVSKWVPVPSVCSKTSWLL